MNEWGLLLGGLVAGGVVGWLFAWLVTKNHAVEAETTASGLRQQLEKLQGELEKLARKAGD